VADAVVDGRDEIDRRQITMRMERLDEPPFPELVALRVEGLGDPVRVDGQQISSAEAELRRPALPCREQAKDPRRRLEPLDGSGAPQEQRRQVPAVRVTQTSRTIVEL